MVVATVRFEGSAEELAVQGRSLQRIAAKHGGIFAGADNGTAGYDLTFAIAYLRDFVIRWHILAESFETFVPWSRCKELCASVKKKVVQAHHDRMLPGRPSICCRITQLYAEGACIYFYYAAFVKGVREPSKAFAAIEGAARRAVLEAGGSLSHHHGIGKLRAPYLRQTSSAPLLSWMRGIKAAVDPHNVFGVANGSLAIVSHRTHD